MFCQIVFFLHCCTVVGSRIYLGYTCSCAVVVVVLEYVIATQQSVVRPHRSDSQGHANTIGGIGSIGSYTNGGCPVHSKCANSEGRGDGDPAARVCDVGPRPGALHTELRTAHRNLLLRIIGFQRLQHRPARVAHQGPKEAQRERER